VQVFHPLRKTNGLLKLRPQNRVLFLQILGQQMKRLRVLFCKQLAFCV
jgi:hypothetical protein